MAKPTWFSRGGLWLASTLVLPPLAAIVAIYAFDVEPWQAIVGAVVLVWIMAPR